MFDSERQILLLITFPQQTQTGTGRTRFQTRKLYTKVPSIIKIGQIKLQLWTGNFIYFIYFSSEKARAKYSMPNEIKHYVRKKGYKKKNSLIKI